MGARAVVRRVVLTLVVVALAGATGISPPVVTQQITLERVSALTLHRAAPLGAAGYGAHMRLTRLDGDEFSFARVKRTAEFDEILIRRRGRQITEVRTAKAEEPATLVITARGVGIGGLAADWNAPLVAPVPPVPPHDELRRRWALAASLVDRALGVLGVHTLTGAEAGPLTLRLRSGDDLSITSRGAPLTHTYSLFALGHPEMAEVLTVEGLASTLTIEVDAARIVVRREEARADRGVPAVELVVEGEAWWAVRDVPGRAPGAAPALTRPEADQLLWEGVDALAGARGYLGILFGRDLRRMRLP